MDKRKNIKSSVRLEASGTGWILTVKDEFSENKLALTWKELKKLKDILDVKMEQVRLLNNIERRRI